MACVHCSVYLTSPGVILDLAMSFECFFVCWLVFKCQIKESGKLQRTTLSSSCWKGLQHSTQTFWNISTSVSSFSSTWGHPQVSPKWPLVPSTSLLLEFSTCRCCLWHLGLNFCQPLPQPLRFPALSWEFCSPMLGFLLIFYFLVQQGILSSNLHPAIV